MNMQAAVAIAKEYISARFAADCPRDLKLETFLYDDHLMVWSLTIGFGRADPDTVRISKLVRVSEADMAVLSVGDP
ncbi:MAG: hypothetical protein ACRD9W_14325 [Terriglobia bacterium]